MSKEYRVYVIRNGAFDSHPNNFDDKEFIERSSDYYWCLDAFVEAFNDEDISSSNDYIRIIETNIED